MKGGFEELSIYQSRNLVQRILLRVFFRCQQGGSYANPLGCNECDPGVTTMVSSAVRKEVKMSVANVR